MASIEILPNLQKQVEITQKLQKVYQLVLATLAIVFIISTGLLLFTAWGIHHSSAQLEKSVQRSDAALACYVKGQLDRSAKGLPANSYFKAHPVELQVALDNIKVQRKTAIMVWGNCPTGGTA
jgi:hypothetical protein